MNGMKPGIFTLLSKKIRKKKFEYNELPLKIEKQIILHYYSETSL